MNWEASSDDDMIDIRVPGRIRLPDMLVEAILFLLGKAGYKCKLTILPLTRYNHPYVPAEPYVSPSPYAPNPYTAPSPNTWEKWTDNTAGYFNNFFKGSTAQESKDE